MPYTVGALVPEDEDGEGDDPGAHARRTRGPAGAVRRKRVQRGGRERGEQELKCAMRHVENAGSSRSAYPARTSGPAGVTSRHTLFRLNHHHRAPAPLSYLTLRFLQILTDMSLCHMVDVL